MAEDNSMIESEPHEIKPYKVGNKLWSISDLNDLRSKISSGFDRLEAIWLPAKKVNGNGDAKSQAFIADAGEKLVQDVAELGSPVTDTNKNAGLDLGSGSKLTLEPQS